MANETQPAPTPWRRPYAAVFLVALAVYGLSAAPGVLWGDSGEVQLRVLRCDVAGGRTLALAHPLYYSLALLTRLVPWGESAYKTNLFTALVSAVAVANVYLLVRRLFADRPDGAYLGALAAATVGLGYTFWWHASAAEVYNLSLAILGGELLCLERYLRTERLGWLVGVFFLNGLECANHFAGVLTLAALAVWMVLAVPGPARGRGLVVGPAAWAVGALPLWLAAGWTALVRGGDVSWLGPYTGSVFNLSVGPWMVLSGAAVIGLNFPSLNILLIPVGLWRARRLGLGRFGSFLGLATAFHFVFAFRYKVPDRYEFYFVTTFLLGLWLVLGAAWAVRGQPARSWRRGAIFALALAGPVVYGGLPLGLGRAGIELGGKSSIPFREETDYFVKPWKTGYRGGDRLAQAVFEQAAPSAIVLAGPTSRVPLIYYQEVHGRRRDVEIVDDLFPEEPTVEKVLHLQDLLRRREVLVVRPFPAYTPRWLIDLFLLEPAGPIYRVTGPNTGAINWYFRHEYLRRRQRDRRP